MKNKSTTRKRHSSAFKAQVALEALQERQTLAELAQQHKLHPNQITQWKKQLQENAASVFASKEDKKSRDQQQLIDHLYKKIGEHQVELDWLKKKSGNG